MKYTKGIRKMFSTNIAGSNINDVAMSALDAGFDLILFNGQVYMVWSNDLVVEDNIKVVSTGLDIHDFEC